MAHTRTSQQAYLVSGPHIPHATLSKFCPPNLPTLSHVLTQLVLLLLSFPTFRFHTMYVFVPDQIGVNFTQNAVNFLANHFNNDHNPSDNLFALTEENMIMAALLATRLKVVVTVVFQIPNQKLVFAEDPSHKEREEDIEGRANGDENDDASSSAGLMGMEAAEVVSFGAVESIGKYRDCC